MLLSGRDEIEQKVLELAGAYSRKQEVSLSDKVNTDLKLDGFDFIDFILDLEGEYKVSLEVISPHSPGSNALDASMSEIIDFIEKGVRALR